jgi:glycerate kinase
VGLGGSATVDGGLGAARALGFRFEDARGRSIERPGALERLTRITPPPVPPLAGPRIVALTDVGHPLLGERGAAAVFGPQKGADPDAVKRLEAGLARLAERWRADLGAPEDLAGRPGAAGAGGLAAGLVAFVGAVLERGPGWCGRLARFGPALSAADAVLTGEGRFDAQSERGDKGTGWVIEQALRAGVPVAVVCAEADSRARARLRTRGVVTVTRSALPSRRARGQAADLLGAPDLAFLALEALDRLGPRRPART